MRWIAIAAGVLLVASLVGSEEQAAEEESPFIYTLEVNGQSHPIKPGKLLTLPAQEGPVKVMLKVAPYRVFKIPGVEFRFPQGWHLQRSDANFWAERMEPWVLEMRRFHLDVWMLRGERDAAKVAEGILGNKPFGKVIRNHGSVRLAGHKVAGTTHYSGRGNVGTVQTYYAVRTGPDAVLFIFRELRMDGLPGEPSTEWKEMERWLQESLKVLPPTDK